MNKVPVRITHLYNVSKSLKTVSHYELQKKHPKPIVLTKNIKLVEDKSYYQISGNLYALHLRGDKRWCRASTYLKPIIKSDLDVCVGKMKIKEKMSLLISQFNPDKSQLIIDVFPAFYPSDNDQLQKVILDHSYYY